MGDTEEPVIEDRSYPYSNYIKTPSEMGASPKGTLEALKKDIDTLGGYVDVLTTGTSRAQKVSGPLGNKYFLTTNTDCKDAQGVAHPRYVFINNIPDKTLFGDYRGLVPGIVQDVLYINPSKLFSVFTQSNLCRRVTMQTRNISNQVKTESKYVLDDDLLTYPAEWFMGSVHPITGLAPGSSTSGNNNNKKKKNKRRENFTIEPDLPEMVYFISLGLLTLYIVVKLLKKPYVQRVITKLKQLLVKA